MKAPDVRAVNCRLTVDSQLQLFLAYQQHSAMENNQIHAYLALGAT